MSDNPASNPYHLPGEAKNARFTTKLVLDPDVEKIADLLRPISVNQHKRLSHTMKVRRKRARRDFNRICERAIQMLARKNFERIASLFRGHHHNA